MLPYTFLAQPRRTAAYPPYALPPINSNGRRLYTVVFTAIAAAAGGTMSNWLVQAAAPLDAEPAGQDEASVSFWVRANDVSNAPGRIDLALLFSNGAREDLIFLQPIYGSGSGISDADLSASTSSPPGQQPVPQSSAQIVFVQSVPSASWVIVHNRNSYPQITTFDSSGNVVEGSITYTNLNQVVIGFGAAFAGDAVLT